MLKKVNYQSTGIHLLADGKEERYTYIDNENEIGKVHLYISEQSLFIDLFEVFEPYRRKGLGTKFITELFSYFPQINKIWGTSTEETLDNFWYKQNGFHFTGEGQDEYEGYFFFEIHKPFC
ncbi:N-acetyltransferase [Bacillus thuringiensis]|uniref:N-acetyltransferase domain-containing protein n=1 Tax=Bacillus thuringiensis TaxID=1428 RepID=A0A9X6WGP4_BACTU|nr:N-acetyltransferase [Bacillus thuringiensis]PFJ24187.1 hypothetical protein COJ15_36820 [Bacillus thuringiensis]